MWLKNSKLVFSSIFLFCCSFELCLSTEFVPVFLWDTVKENTAQLSPAMHRISKDSFKEILSEKLKNNPMVIVFAEETLSPEDFTHRDPNGKTLFTSLHNYLETAENAEYKPYVQNPVDAVKTLGKSITEIPVNSLSHENIPRNEIIIVDLNDAKDGEERNEMLKRHDSTISKIFEDLSESNDNILAIYTAKHASWIIPEIKHRNVRNLLEETPKAAETDGQVMEPITDEPSLLLYVTSSPEYSDDSGIEFKPIDLKTEKCEKTDNEIDLVLTGNGQSYNFAIEIGENGYWRVSNVTSGEEDFTIPAISAPLGFSYHCHDVFLTSDKKILKLPGFQIQPFTTDEKDHSFGDPYDCVGFTTIPIWTGIFVTILLLLILTFGITMMMDIRTMDKFDDAKGKTITINAAD